MDVIVRKYREDDIPEMIRIWNEVIEEGIAFPQEDYLAEETGKSFFAEQTYCAVAECKNNSKIYGMYILHPNNVGRCGHIGNASFAVSSGSRGKHIGEKLV
ncbi:MAG TPA: GNAT family N-acetyltransferase, partial [Oscillospiraceae bacterium]|nr:GNAT family N-acetyltransferase [Oscillospiraceae bacterium]